MKKKILYIGHYTSISGYGEHSRDILKMLLYYYGNNPDIDIDILLSYWGNTLCYPVEFVYNNILNLHSYRNVNVIRNINQQYDLLIQLGLPTELLVNAAKTKILITAGVETDHLPEKWKNIELLSNIDTIIVPSTFTEKLFKDIALTRTNIVTLSELSNIYESGIIPIYDEELLNALNKYKFLICVSNDIPRKNLNQLIRIFNENDIDDIKLLIKYCGSYSGSDIDNFKKKLKKNILAIFGELSDSQLKWLYQHENVIGMITTTHGEGFGRPLFDFAVTTGKPIIAPNWSGYLDYLRNYENYIPIEGYLRPLRQDETMFDILTTDMRWFECKDKYVIDAIYNIKYYNDKKPLQYNKEEIYSRFKKIIDENLEIKK